MSFSNFVSNINRIYSPFKEWYSKINPANMTGAIDVIVVQQPDGTYLSSPFHVRFGKYGVLKACEKIVDIEVNEMPVSIHMKLDDNGAAYFVEPVDTEDEDEEVLPELATSPIPQDSWLLMESRNRKKRSNSCSSTSSTSSHKSISRRKLELIAVSKRKCVEATIGIQTDQICDDSILAKTKPQEPSILSTTLTENTPGMNRKPSRKKKRLRDQQLLTRHSRNNSKTSLKDMLLNADMDNIISAFEDDIDLVPGGSLGKLVADGDVDIFEMDDEKEDFSERSTFVSAAESRKNSSSSFRNVDEVDRAVPTNPTSDSISFLLSRLPDQEKLESILEHQAEMEKHELPSSPRSKLSAELAATQHYFSEPELTPVTSPIGSRPGTPILSDSELEIPQRHSSINKHQQEEQSWEWGKLPTTANTCLTTASGLPVEVVPTVAASAPATSHLEAAKAAELNKNADGSAGWGLSYLWGGRSKSSVNNTTGGIYLDDLKDGDDEMLQLYVGRINGASPTSGRNDSTSSGGESGVGQHVPHVVVIDDDSESGKGQSLPMSPRSVETSFDDHHRSLRRALADVDLSLCGGLEDNGSKFSTMMFEQSKISYDDFVLHLQTSDTSLFNNPNLVVRIGEQYYKWSAACPIIMSTILYGRSLPSDLVEVIRGHFQEPKLSPILEATTPVASSLQKKNSSSWWPFGGARKEDEIEKANDVSPSLTPSAANLSLPIQPQLPSSRPSTPNLSPQVSQESESSPKMVTRYSMATQTEFIDFSGKFIISNDADESENLVGVRVTKPREKFRKTLRLSNDAINCLNLLPGMNEVQFSVTTAYQGTTRCSCHLYLWKWSDKIVISDIDGTITKSDVLGHVLPVIGRDWAQSGVAELFTKIKNNGYHMAYLSARAIGQASFTKDYLASIRQGDVNLPDGPLLLNPTSLMSALHREVIEKKPEKFKIACLNDIKTLFPEDHNPFFAGYGNRTNDVIAYTAVGIPSSRIFTINYKGELKHEALNFQTSYSTQSSIADHLFPPLTTDEDSSLQNDTSPTAQLEFSNFTFWRDQLPAIDNNNTLEKIPPMTDSKVSSKNDSPTK